MWTLRPYKWLLVADLMFRMVPFLDRHLIFPVFNFLQDAIRFIVLDFSPEPSHKQDA